MTLILVIVAVALGFLGGVVYSYLLRLKEGVNQPAANTPEPTDRVIVNVPADLKPFPQLDAEGRVVAGERALVWVAVYRHTVDGFDGDMDVIVAEAVSAADRAIDKVFGPSQKDSVTTESSSP